MNMINKYIVIQYRNNIKLYFRAYMIILDSIYQYSLVILIKINF